MRPPTRKSAAPMWEPSSAPSMLSAMRRKSAAFIISLACCAWLKSRPVNSLLECFIGWEDRFEGECKFGWAVRFEVRDAALGLVNSGNVAHRYPPQCGVNTCKLLKPCLPLTEQLRMGCVIDVMTQLLDRFPDRHVHQHHVVVEWAEIGCIAIILDKPPDKPGTRIGKGVNFVEPIDKSRHHGIVELRFDTADVDLRDVVPGHRIPPQVDAKTYAVALISSLSNSSLSHFENAAKSSSRPRKSRTISRPGFDPPCSSTNLR